LEQTLRIVNKGDTLVIKEFGLSLYTCAGAQDDLIRPGKTAKIAFNDECGAREGRGNTCTCTALINAPGGVEGGWRGDGGEGGQGVMLGNMAVKLARC